jgi:hypothetical protein
LGHIYNSSVSPSFHHHLATVQQFSLTCGGYIPRHPMNACDHGYYQTLNTSTVIPPHSIW